MAQISPLYAGQPPILIHNVKVLDGSDRLPYPAQVLLQGSRIVAVEEGRVLDSLTRAQRVDGAGGWLLPGLIESHAHLSFADTSKSVELGEIPPEEHTLLAAKNARRMLEQGFTSCVSAATAAKPRLDIVIRNAINDGSMVGPRLLAAGPELTGTGGLGDPRLLHMFRENYGMVCDGPEAFRAAARMLVREGVDTLKINISGDGGTPTAPAECTVMTEAEIAAVCEVAQAHGKRVAAHARSAESVKRALRQGVQILYHATLLDTQALDLLEQARERVFVAPTLGALYAVIHEAEQWGFTPQVVAEKKLLEEFEQGVATMRELIRRGVRVLPGGDYGFAWNPIGRDARDIEHFVRYLGLSPLQAILSATKLGGEIMMMPNELGRIRPDYLADLLIVDGDPIDDVALLQDATRLRLIMQDGRIVKNTLDPGGTR